MAQCRDDQSFKGGDGQCSCNRGNTLGSVCLDHRTICCDVCLSEDHSECLNIRALSDVAEERRNKIGTMKLTRKMETLTSQMDKLIKEKESSKIKLDDQMKKITNGIDEKIEQTMKNLRSLQTKLKDKANRLHSVETGKLRLHVMLIRDFIKQSAKLQNDLDGVLTNGTPLEIFVYTDNMLASLLKKYQQLEARLVKDSEVDFVLSLNSIGTGVKQLGKIESIVDMPKPVSDILLWVDDFMENMSVQFLPTKPGCRAQIPITGPRTANVLLDRPSILKTVMGDDVGKHEIYLPGGAFIPNGGLLMADYDNKRLLRFDDDFRFQQAYELDGRPSSLVFGSDTELYVIVNECFVYICELTDTFTVSNKFEIGKKEAWGIAIDQDVLIVGCYGFILYLNKDGNKVTELDKSGCFATNIAFSPTLQAVFYKAADNLVCRKRDGTIVRRHVLRPETYVSGICLDADENIYICDRDSGKVHQISSSGKTQREILEKLDNIKCPIAVIFHPVKKIFVVTSSFEKTAFEVYHFEK